MAIYNEVLYFYGTLDQQGVLRNIWGEIFANAPAARDGALGNYLYSAPFWSAGDLSGGEGSTMIGDAVSDTLSGKVVSIETDFFFLGEPQKILLNFIPRYGQEGTVSEVFFFAVNVRSYMSETAYYKERSEQLLFAAETAEIGLFFWDLSKDEIFTTPKFNDLYGLAPDEIMTREKFTRVIHPADVGLVNDTIARSHINYGECTTEYRVVPDDTERWIWIRGKTFPATEHSPSYTMGSGLDITSRKHSDKRFDDLLASEKEARDEVESANQAKDQFIATVGHELRAPLNAILGWVKILQSKDLNAAATASALETIERSARVQAKLINDLVDSSKIISGKLNLEFHPVTLSNALNFVVEAQRPLAEAKNISLDMNDADENLSVNADLGRLQQIFTNLVANAIKFTSDGGRISVGVKRDGRMVAVRVSDTGKGIEQAELPHIFERFFQAKFSKTADKSGLGLGLSIVAALVKQHGGTVTAESDGADTGSVFTVRFPLAEEQQVAVEERNGDKHDLSSEPLKDLLILLVEDNDDSREVLEIFLNQMGAQVLSADSAANAMDSLNSNGRLPHLILSDISMPDEDGYSLMARIRKLPATKGGSMPAIALTAFASPDDKKRSLESGFQIHHVKPFEPTVLITEILELTS
jgi:signal transduction histidine kinase